MAESKKIVKIVPTINLVNQRQLELGKIYVCVYNIEELINALYAKTKSMA